MQAILVFIDGTICDTRPRHPLYGSPDFYSEEKILGDKPVSGSVSCLQELALQYQIVYIGARPDFTLDATQKWLRACGYPEGPVVLAETQEERLALAQALQQGFHFAAGIGDRWDDNELHNEIGCLSIILHEYEGRWETVARRVAAGQQRRA